VSRAEFIFLAVLQIANVIALGVGAWMLVRLVVRKGSEQVTTPADRKRFVDGMQSIADQITILRLKMEANEGPRTTPSEFGEVLRQFEIVRAENDTFYRQVLRNNRLLEGLQQTLNKDKQDA
jgi:hypothetical protein